MQDAKRIAQEAHDLMEQGYSCSEAMLIAVGNAVLDPLDDRIIRLTTAWGGGLGSTQQEVCGALSGGVMVISAQYGRTLPTEDKTHCRALAAEFRARFEQTFGYTRCGDLLADGYGSAGHTPCKVLVQRAAWLLLDVLNGEDDPPTS